MVTLKDIAKEAGVSTATVSNVVNGNLSKVSHENAARIQEIINRRGYVPNSSARALSVKSSRIIAGILLMGKEENLLTDVYNAHFFGAVSLYVQKRGYYMMLHYVDSYREVTNSLRSWNIDGAIFVGMFEDDIQKIIDANDMPLIFTDSYTDIRQISNIGIDDRKGGMLAAACFVKNGHRDVAFLGFHFYADDSLINQRLLGYRNQLLSSGLSLEEKNLFFVNSNDVPGEVDSIAASIKERKDRPTGVFASSDNLAFQFMEALKRRGLSVPEDISLIGFDDLPVAEYMTPKLTTIRQDIDRKARLAVEKIVYHLENGQAPSESIVLDVSLIERDSVRSMHHE